MSEELKPVTRRNKNSPRMDCPQPERGYMAWHPVLGFIPFQCDYDEQVLAERLKEESLYSECVPVYCEIRPLKPMPAPDQSDRERARLYLSGFHVELYDGINRADIEPQKVIDSLAAEFAAVRDAATKAERERCERILDSRGKDSVEAELIRKGEP